MAGALSGAAVGAGIDLAHAGLSLGLFTTLGGAIGTAGALFGGRRLSARTRLLGVGLGSEQVQVGPNASVQFLHVLLDRALLFYAHIINWAHGRRDSPGDGNPAEGAQAYPPGVRSGQWQASSLKVCRAYFQALREGNEERGEIEEKSLQKILTEALMSISHSENGG